MEEEVKIRLIKKSKNLEEKIDLLNNKIIAKKQEISNEEVKIEIYNQDLFDRYYSYQMENSQNRIYEDSLSIKQLLKIIIYIIICSIFIASGVFPLLMTGVISMIALIIKSITNICKSQKEDTQNEIFLNERKILDTTTIPDIQKSIKTLKSELELLTEDLKTAEMDLFHTCNYLLDVNSSELEEELKNEHDKTKNLTI